MIDWRWADGRPERLDDLARDLVRSNVDLIVAWSNEAIAVARRATRTIPIVMAGGALPVEAGFVASLARPGGNVTGTTYNPPEVAGKIVEVLKEAVPTLSRVTIVWNPEMPGTPLYKPHADRAAQLLTITLSYIDVRRREEFGQAFDRIAMSRPEALYVVTDPVVGSAQEQIVSFALRRRLPTIGVTREFVKAGGLLYFGLSTRSLWERTASYMDRVLRGANPADLPVEEPTKYELVLNLKTARAVGVTMPPSLLVRVDDVID